MRTMNPIKRMTAATLAAATMFSMTGCGDKTDSSTQLEAEKNADGNYNILFLTTDQEHYFNEFPNDSEYKARQLLQEMGTTFEKHYTCSNVSTSSRSVIYTGTHITDTKMLDNTDLPWQSSLSEDLTTIGDRMNTAGYYSAYKGIWAIRAFYMR